MGLCGQSSIMSHTKEQGINNKHRDLSEIQFIIYKYDELKKKKKIVESLILRQFLFANEEMCLFLKRPKYFICWFGFLVNVNSNLTLIV